MEFTRKEAKYLKEKDTPASVSFYRQEDEKEIVTGMRNYLTLKYIIGEDKYSKQLKNLIERMRSLNHEER